MCASIHVFRQRHRCWRVEPVTPSSLWTYLTISDGWEHDPDNDIGYGKATAGHQELSKHEPLSTGT
jgi:hypothetical protein